MVQRSRKQRARAAFSIAAALAATALLAFTGSGSAASMDKPENTSPPSIAGKEQEGHELAAEHGDWTNSPDSYEYQWQRCNSGGSGCSDISGATEKQYTVGSADVGNRVRVVVIAMSGSDESDPSASGPTDVISPAGTAPTNSSPPTISGTAQDNQKVTASPGTWNGSTPITYAYEWRRCDSNGNDCKGIAAGQTYEVTSHDVGHRFRVVVTATNSAGSNSATSAPTSVALAAGAAPKNTASPKITGTPQDGQTLTAAVGTWTSTAAITFSYQWMRCDSNGKNCQSIGGATGATYKATSADVGHRLRVGVTAKNTFGSNTSTTDTTAVVAAAGPAGATKLPNGTTSIPITSVSLPDRLAIDQVTFTPSTIGSLNERVAARFRVVDSNGYVVRDALVYAIGVPANRVAVPPEAKTDQNGWATVVYIPLRGLPLKNGARLTIFVRARKPGGSLLGGVSTRRLVSIGVHPM